MASPIRVLLKITGEAFGSKSEPLNMKKVQFIVEEIKCATDELSVQLAVVVGGGNFIRGKDLKPDFHDKSIPDRMGMLGTVMNALTLKDQLNSQNIQTRVLSSVEIKEICEPYIQARAVRHLEKGRTIILAGGTGNPNFTTDTAAIEKALDIGASRVLKATKVDGIYTADPKKSKDAKLIKRISYSGVLRKNLKILDQAAIGLAREKKMPILVFNMFKKGNLLLALREKIGSKIY